MANLFEQIKNEFPMLKTQMSGHPLLYLDSAATALKPQSVIDSLNHYHEKLSTNIHRSVNKIAEEATALYEDTRDQVQKFINAKSRNEIIFTKGATEAINLVARSYGENFINAGDEILITQMEHHSNIVPWHLLSEKKNITLRYIPVTKTGELDLTNLSSLLNSKTKLVSITGLSNVLGTINPIEKIIKAAHEVKAKILIDGAQLITHQKVDVQKLDCDFFVFSAHKLFGPTGVGILFGKEDLLNLMPPFLGGGDMIDEVTMEKTTFNKLPYKFEAGTPNIANVIAFQEAIKFVERIGIEKINAHENHLLKIFNSEVEKDKDFELYGTSKEKAAIVAFNIKGIHSHDLGTMLSEHGIAIRTGHHCAQPLLKMYQIPSCARVSFSVYNQESDIKRFMDATVRIKKLFL